MAPWSGLQPEPLPPEKRRRMLGRSSELWKRYHKTLKTQNLRVATLIAAIVKL